MSSISETVAEALRLLSMRGVLAPCVRILPRALVLALAHSVSFLLLLLPSEGLRAYWEIRAAFGRGRIESVLIARRRLALPLCTFVIHKRILIGREDAHEWRIEERNRQAVADIIGSGDSYILATGHFNRLAAIVLNCPKITPGTFVQSAHPDLNADEIPDDSEDGAGRSLRQALRDKRVRYQMHAGMKAWSAAWDRDIDLIVVDSARSSARLLFSRLRKPGAVVNISVDAPWEGPAAGSYERPFAGSQRRRFATGAARLAKLSRCPIVCCTYWVEDDGTFVVEWHEPVTQVADEIEVMDRLLDYIEVAVGRRPSEYVMDIGYERRWSPETESWHAAT